MRSTLLQGQYCNVGALEAYVGDPDPQDGFAPRGYPQVLWRVRNRRNRVDADVVRRLAPVRRPWLSCLCRGAGLRVNPNLTLTLTAGARAALR